MQGDEPRSMGRLGSTFGIKGYLKVQSFTEQPENLFDYSPWYISRRGDDWREVQVEAFKPHGDTFIVKLHGVDVREEAALLTGMDIGIRRSSLPPASDGEFYLCDLEGCTVIGINDVCLGTVSRVMDQGAAPLLVVSPSDRTKGDRKERLIPFVKGPIVTDVDLESGIIRVEWGEDY
ncbi:Ribosome maturation factor rimM [Anaerobiospirillum thomasii]|uniref:Ribosome maturation factor RimM n=2 Tax=Anaerobiospirillum thomasii TaxID=179995 RepID=A0A2X0V2N1_9GAMM|nr:Ribosome maturation factor rimM [Anaerobiospirillum thomasii]SPT68799.1 Ribosome maturation factor rimM [Anaerobiospirillum thomasii]